MFTGIVEAIGRITALRPGADGLVMDVDLAGLDTTRIRPGDSIAVNGACLTVTRLEGGVARFDVSSETLDKCLVGRWREGDRVNLEPALTLQKPLGGHLVSGHVDGTGILDSVTPGPDSTWMRFLVPRELGRYIAIKGSVALDGVSLTTNRVTDIDAGTRFELTLVPHTLAMTTLGDLDPGDRVHVEVDLLARYLDRMQQQETH